MSGEHHASHGAGLLDRLRFRLGSFAYRFYFRSMVQDASWRRPLLESLSPRPGERILDFGPGSASTALELARRFPECSIVGADPDERSVIKGRQKVLSRGLKNVELEVGTPGRLPFGASSFDKVVCVLTFHDLDQEGKIRIAREMLRVLRRGGTLHVADYDRPVARGEHAVLKLARFVSGEAAAQPHMDGSWTKGLEKAGFLGVRRLSTHSVWVGRVAIVRGRKS